MKLKFLGIIILTILYHCLNEEIISFPDNVNSYRIKTKNGVIYLKMGQYLGNSENNCNYLTLIGVKNLDLYTSPDTKEIKIDIHNDIIKFEIYDNNINKLNPLLCDLFYQTHYIEKKIYSVENNERNNPYKYFGGTPQRILKNLNKFEFLNNLEIPAIYLLRNYQEEEKEENYNTIIFNPQDILEFNEGFEKNCAKSMIEEFGTIFWEFDIIKFRFEDDYKDKIITFRNKKSEKDYKGSFGNLFYDDPCDNLVLGSKFLDLINIREFNLETGRVTLYTTDDNDAIKDRLFN